MNTIEDPQTLPEPMEVNFLPENLHLILPEQTLIEDDMLQVSQSIQNDAQMPCWDMTLNRSPLPKLKKVQKTIQKVNKKKLVIDKVTKLPGSKLEKSCEDYEKNLMVSLICLNKCFANNFFITSGCSSNADFPF